MEIDLATRQAVAPESLEGIATLMRRMTDVIVHIRARDAQAQKDCAPILKRAARETAPMRREVFKLARVIDSYARRHKKTLTENGKKVTAKVPGGGELRWRKSKPAVKISDEEAVLAYLLSRGTAFEDFIRKTPSINKVAMTERPIRAARVPGVRIQPNRKFVIKPPGIPERLERATSSKQFEIVTPKAKERSEG